MGIISDFVSRIGIGNKGSVETEQKAASLETGSDAFASSLGGNFNENFSSFNNQKQQLQSYVEWVYAASSTIAEHCAAIDFRLYQNNTKIKNMALGQKLIYYPKEIQKLQRNKLNVVETKNGEFVMRKGVSPLEELYSHPLLDLLHNPNPFMVKNEFLEITFLHLMLTGDAFWAINRDKKGKPAEMWPLMPDRVTVVPDKTKFLLGYLYQINGEQVPFSPDDIIHHKLANPTNFHRGYSPIMAGARTIDADSHASDWNRRVMYNSATPNGVFKTDAKLDDKVFKRLKDELMNTFAGASNHGRPAVLEQGLDFKSISMNQKDMDFLNLRKFSRDQILALLGVPKSVLGLDESMSRANAETSEYVFSKRNRNKMQRLTNRITEDLAIQFGANLIVSFTDPVPDDKQFLLKETEASLGQGIPWRSPNEARAERGDDPVEGGDELYVPSSVVPMGEPEADPAVAAKPAVVNEPDDPDELNDEEDPGSDDGSGDNSDASDNSSSSGASGSATSETTNSPGGQVQAGFTATQLKQLRELIGEATKSTKAEYEPVVASPKKKVAKYGPNREVPNGYTLCLCCMGWGEHNTEYECYRCDGGGVVTAKEDEQPMPCDGAYEDGNGGKGQKQQKEQKMKTPAFLASINTEKFPSFPALIKQADALPEFPPSLPAPEVLSEPEPANTIPPTADDEAADTSTKLEINDAMANWLSRRAKLVDGSEKHMIREAMEHFLLQKQEVLSNIHRLINNEKAVGKRKVKEAKKEMNNLFDKTASATAWATALGPVYANLSIKAGDSGMDLVNDPQKYGYEAEAPETPFAYDANTAPIKQYFTERAGTISQGIDAETDKQLRATLTEGLNAGESLQELADRVEGVYNAAAGYRALRIARTETQSALHFASAQAWEQSGVVENYIWLTAADPCKLICAFVANTVAKKVDGFKIPGGSAPAHPNCFSSDTEVLTDQGYKLFKNLVGDELIASVNLNSGEHEYVAIKNHTMQKVDRIIHYNSENIDLAISEDHNNVLWDNKGRRLVSEHDMPEKVYANPLAISYSSWVLASDIGEEVTRTLEEGEAYVYDIELEKHHTLFVRRNGKVLLSGNCRCETVPYTVSGVKALDNVDIATITEKAIKYNPNHDSDGKFSTGDHQHDNSGQSSDSEGGGSGESEGGDGAFDGAGKTSQEISDHESSLKAASTTKEETNALAQYASVNCSIINGYTRGSDKDGPSTQLSGDSSKGREPDTVGNVVNKLDSLTAKNTLQANSALYRGAVLSPDSAARLTVGSSITDRAFVSTSLSRSKAEEFAVPSIGQEAKGKTGVLIRIDAPASTNGVYINSTLNKSSAEHEFLMPRDTTLSINSIGKTSVNGVELIVVNASVMGNG